MVTRSGATLLLMVCLGCVSPQDFDNHRKQTIKVHDALNAEIARLGSQAVQQKSSLMQLLESIQEQLNQVEQQVVSLERSIESVAQASQETENLLRREFQDEFKTLDRLNENVGALRIQVQKMRRYIGWLHPGSDDA